MQWYLIHTKPRQEKCALQNLERQGYTCYLPLWRVEKMRQGNLAVADAPLFPRYLFIQLGLSGSAKSWSPIRSTTGVSRLVCFGIEPAKVDERLVAALRFHEARVQDQPRRLFSPGERVKLTGGAFADIEGVYQISDGASRVIVLIDLLGKRVPLSVSPASLRKAA